MNDLNYSPTHLKIKKIEKKMLISELIPPESIKTHLEAEDKEELFEELVDLLVNANSLNIRNNILSAIREREAKGTTGIGGGIAVPHAKIDSITRPMAVIGISKHGIDFEATDGKPANLIFLIITEKANSAEHLKILQQIAKLAKHTDFVQKVISANDAKATHKVICDFEDEEG